jgi:hypothetical protein
MDKPFNDWLEMGGEYVLAAVNKLNEPFLPNTFEGPMDEDENILVENEEDDDRRSYHEDAPPIGRSPQASDGSEVDNMDQVSDVHTEGRGSQENERNSLADNGDVGCGCCTNTLRLLWCCS